MSDTQKGWLTVAIIALIVVIAQASHAGGHPDKIDGPDYSSCSGPAAGSC